MREKTGRTPTQFALAWLWANRIVTSVIAGPRTLEQWKDYVAALGTPWTRRGRGAGRLAGAPGPSVDARLQRSEYPFFGAAARVGNPDGRRHGVFGTRSASRRSSSSSHPKSRALSTGVPRSLMRACQRQFGERGRARAPALADRAGLAGVRALRPRVRRDAAAAPRRRRPSRSRRTCACSPRARIRSQRGASRSRRRRRATAA